MPLVRFRFTALALSRLLDPIRYRLPNLSPAHLIGLVGPPVIRWVYLVRWRWSAFGLFSRLLCYGFRSLQVVESVMSILSA